MYTLCVINYYSRQEDVQLKKCKICFFFLLTIYCCLLPFITSYWTTEIDQLFKELKIYSILHVKKVSSI